MKNYANLGGCYSPRPITPFLICSASFNND